MPRLQLAELSQTETILKVNMNGGYMAGQSLEKLSEGLQLRNSSLSGTCTYKKLKFVCSFTQTVTTGFDKRSVFQRAMATPQILLFTLVAFLVVLEMGSAAETPPKSVTISFPPSEKFVCSIDPTTGTDIDPNNPAKPSDICTPSIDKPTRLILSYDNDVVSARYQWKTPVQLWKRNSRYVASFNAFFVVNFDRDAEFTQRPLFSGGGLALAITPDLSVVGTGPETFALFPINEATGASLRGPETKTVAVEMDLSRVSNDGFDPLAPHVGLDINSMKSVKTKYLGDPNTVIDVKFGVWVEYDALKKTLQVFLHKVKADLTPKRQNANIAISYTGLDLVKEVKEFSYVGFGSRVPETPNGVYVIYDFTFTTKWVLGSTVNK